MQPVETCEVCGKDVAPDEGISLELAVEDLICPTPMRFHRHCYESAEDLWSDPAGKTLCQVDPEFPEETGKWLEISRRSAESGATSS